MRDNSIYQNIKALSKMKGLKLGDVEKSVGLSVGYLSRHKAISSTVLVKLSDIFEISIDDIIRSNFVDEEQKRRIVKDLKNDISAASSFFLKSELMKEIITVLNEIYQEEQT